jgi:hypothetical protein
MKLPRLVVAAVVAGATLAVMSCGDPSASPVGPRTLLLPLPGDGLLTCSPLAADSVTATIGPAGGTLQVGPHILSIPAGALAQAVSITAVAPADTVNRVRFEPEGLTFQQPASLTLSYANCQALPLGLPAQIAYTSDALAILQVLTSVDTPLAQTVTAPLSHFSDYAVAW